MPQLASRGEGGEEGEGKGVIYPLIRVNINVARLGASYQFV